MATIRLNYPKISAVAGPCGLWPEDLGPSIKNKSYFENKPYYNFGCANQRNLAAMVDNPADLVQPRPETPAYTADAPHRLRQVSQGHHDRDHLSRIRQGQTQRYRQMISYARQNTEQQPDARDRPRTITSRRRRACRCRRSARRWKPRPPCSRRAKTAGSARLISRSRWAAWRPPSRPIASAPTPNVIILETEGRTDILAGLDQLATVCDAGTRVVVIGKINDVTLYRELVRRGVSDYVHRAGQHASTSCARSATCSRRRKPRPSAASSPSSAPRAASAPPPSRTTSPGRSRAIWRWIPWSPTSISLSAPPASTTIRIRRRASPTRCSRRIASIPPSSTACCRSAPTISACWRRRRRSTGSTISAPRPSIRSSTRFAPRCRASCSTFPINGRAGPSAR